MTEKEKEIGNIEIIQEELPKEMESFMPSLNVNIPTTENQEEKKELDNLVSDDALLGIYGEILQSIREDRNEVSDLLAKFIDMVMNEDSSSAAKEAVVNLFKIKSDLPDKMSKIADLMTRIKLKDRDTFPKYLAQNNTINIGDKQNTRGFLAEIQKAKDSKKDKK